MKVKMLFCYCLISLLVYPLYSQTFIRNLNEEGMYEG